MERIRNPIFRLKAEATGTVYEQPGLPEYQQLGLVSQLWLPASAGRLRRKAHAIPRAVRPSYVLQPVVQAVGPPLPELELVRDHTVTAPPLGPGDGLAVHLACHVEARLERLAAFDRIALPRRVVGIGFFGSDLLDGAVDPHLPLEGRPEEEQAGAAARRHLARLAAAVVGIEHEPLAVHPLEEHGANRRASVARGCGQRHGRR